MSADEARNTEVLREAAAQMRVDWPLGRRCPDSCACEDEPVMSGYHDSAHFHRAVADLLDVISGFPLNVAVAVADVYLNTAEVSA